MKTSKILVIILLALLCAIQAKKIKTKEKVQNNKNHINTRLRNDSNTTTAEFDDTDVDNSDIFNRDEVNPDFFTPVIVNPAIAATSVIVDPAIAATPAIVDPVIATPVIATPVIATPVIVTPVIAAPEITNPVIATPEITNPVTNAIVEGPFQIVSKLNGKCITSAGEGNSLVLTYCTYNSEESNWFKIEYKPGVFMYMNQKTYLVLETDCSSSQNGSPIREWTKLDKPTQMWTLTKEDKYIKLNSVADSNKCMTAAANGRTLYQWECASKDDQLWVTRVPTFQFSSSKLMIKSNQSGLCMKSSGPNQKLIQVACDVNDNRQAFTFYENEDKSFFIFVKDDLVLDNFEFNESNGNPVFTWDITNAENQQWYLVPFADSSNVSFLNKQTGKCLDVPNGQPSEGITMQQWECTGNESQSFSLIESNVVKIPKGDTYIYLNYPNKCLSFFVKQQATQNNCVFGNGLQAWSLTINDDGTYFIRNVYTGHTLSWVNYNEINVSPVFSGEDDQRWWVYTVDSQNVKIRNKKTGRCISVINGAMNSGLNLGLSECTDNNIYQNLSFKNFDYVPMPQSNQQYFQIVNKATNKCVRMKNIFSQLQQWECDNEDMSLVWRATKNSDNSYSLISLSGFVMDDYTFGWGNGNPIVGWEPNGTDSQKWFLIPINQDYFAIIQASHAKCLDLPGASPADGALLQLWDCLDNSANQSFILKKVNVKQIPTSYVQITNSDNSKCMNINTIYKTPFLMPCSSGDSYTQAFKLEANADSSFYIRAYGGLIVDLSNPQNAWENGLDLLMMPIYNKIYNQKWYILPEGKYFRLINFHSRKCFNIAGSSSNDGSNFEQWDCIQGQSSQLFSFTNSSVKDLINSWVSISNKKTDCLSFRGINDRLVLDSCKENFEGQSWKFTLNPDNSYSINLPNGYIIENAGEGKYDGNEINTSQQNGSDAQKWFIVPVGNTSFSFVNKGSTKCLDMSVAETSPERVLVIWNCDINNENQIFNLTLSKVEEIPVGRWVKIVNKNSGKCVKSIRYKNRVENFSCDDDDSSNAWKLIKNDDGTFKIQNFAGVSLLTISDGNDAFVTSEIPWNTQDKWFLLPNTPGFYGLLNFANRRCLDLTSGDTRDGNPFQLWDCKMGVNDNQAFALLPMVVEELPTGWIQIINKKTNNCLKYNGETDQITDGNCCTDKNSTYWSLIQNDNITYRILSFNGKSSVVELKSNLWDNGTPIQTNSWTGTDAQRWLIAPNSKEYFNLIHPGHNRCIANNDSKYDFSVCSEKDNLLFYFKPIYDLKDPCGNARIR